MTSLVFFGRIRLGLERAYVPLALAVAVFGGDALLRWWRPDARGLGVLDELGHLATAVVLITALTALNLPSAALVGVLIGSVAIDVDHAGILVRHGFDLHGTTRPDSHSLMTVLVLLAVAMLARGRVRQVLAGLAVGVLLHFVRDVATGPGLELFWPLSGRFWREPYAGYAATLTVAALLATARLRARHRGHAEDPPARSLVSKL